MMMQGKFIITKYNVFVFIASYLSHIIAIKIPIFSACLTFINSKVVAKNKDLVLKTSRRMDHAKSLKLFPIKFCHSWLL